MFTMPVDAGDEEQLRVDEGAERPAVPESEGEPIQKEKEPHLRRNEGNCRGKAETLKHPQNGKEKAQEVEAAF